MMPLPCKNPRYRYKGNVRLAFCGNKVVEAKHKTVKAFELGDKVLVTREINMPRYAGDGEGVIYRLPKKGLETYSVELTDDGRAFRSIAVHKSDMVKR